MSQRTCARCGRTPDEVEFRRDKRRKSDGLGAYCKPCGREYNRAYYAANKAKINAGNNARYHTNRDRYLAQQRLHRRANIEAYRARGRDRLSNPEYRATAIERSRQYRLSHKREMRAYFAAWYERNRERVAENCRSWRQRNQDRVNAYIARRLMRMRGQNGKVERIDRRAVWVRDFGICGLCGRPVDFEAMHLDHIIPLVRGGPHTFDNVQPSHPKCNLRKRDREVARWALGVEAVPSRRVRRRTLVVVSPNSPSRSSKSVQLTIF